MDENTLKKYWWLFTEAWKYFRKHSDPQKEEWPAILEEAKAFEAAYRCEFAHDLMKACLDELERIYKRK